MRLGQAGSTKVYCKSEKSECKSEKKHGVHRLKIILHRFLISYEGEMEVHNEEPDQQNLTNFPVSQEGSCDTTRLPAAHTKQTQHLLRRVPAKTRLESNLGT